jgi:hypothetical protein
VYRYGQFSIGDLTSEDTLFGGSFLTKPGDVVINGKAYPKISLELESRRFKNEHEQLNKFYNNVNDYKIEAYELIDKYKQLPHNKDEYSRYLINKYYDYFVKDAIILREQNVGTDEIIKNFELKMVKFRKIEKDNEKQLKPKTNYDDKIPSFMRQDSFGFEFGNIDNVNDFLFPSVIGKENQEKL